MDSDRLARQPCGALLFDLLDGSANVALVHLGGKPEGIEGLPEASVQWGDVDKHERLGVAAEGALEQVGQLGVAVRHVALLGRNTTLDTKLLKNSNYSETLFNSISI